MFRVDSSRTHPHSSVTDTSLGVFFMYSSFSIFLFHIISFCEDTFLGDFSTFIQKKTEFGLCLRFFILFLHDYV